ncbi:GTP-binding protein [Herbaspirillum sp. YR522]|uniref:CobW family GTP-binding protein n=1 Tax=Herbaspirillum sp. YR522 TaxID=1144342 RepID=UPI00026F9101|nr:GTP-binding protein [Herbaspirillum sp. YR522]EJN06961.1 putative GTPase, G3E family [Herbaspirillum sp. YR522]
MRSSDQGLPSALPPIPVTVVTGFLGAGKTTLLRDLVRRRQARRLALLINEFGEVAIDGDLLRSERPDGSSAVQVQDFAHGLIAYGDDDHFVPAMLALAARRAQIDHVLIETSGLALPSAVMEVLQSPQLAPHFVLDATLAVVDTPLLLDQPAGHGAALDASALLFRQQLECADVVVLNKIDAMDEPQLLQAEQQVRALAPNVRFLELAYGARLDIRLALGLRLHQAGSAVHHHYTALGMPGERSAVLADQGRLNGHAHSGLAAHSHGLSTHRHFHEQDPGWLSFTLRCEAPQDPQRLQQALTAAALAEPILRAKGFVHAGGTRTVLVQGVRARVALLESQPGRAAQARSELVIIGYHPSRAKVAQLLTEFTGTDWK